MNQGLAMLKSSKFWIGVLGLIVTAITALKGKMDANVMGCVITICGGFMGANTLITRKALAENTEPPPPAQ